MQDVTAFTVAARYYALLGELKAVTDEAGHYRQDIVNALQSSHSESTSTAARHRSVRTPRPATLREVLSRVKPNTTQNASPRPVSSGATKSGADRGLEAALETEVQALRERIAASDSRYEALLALEELEESQFEEEMRELQAQLDNRAPYQYPEALGTSPTTNLSLAGPVSSPSRIASGSEYSVGSPQRRRLERLLLQLSTEDRDALLASSPNAAPLITALHEHKALQAQLRILIAQRRQLLELDEAGAV